jgi:hypothetical protein
MIELAWSWALEPQPLAATPVAAMATAAPMATVRCEMFFT